MPDTRPSPSSQCDAPHLQRRNDGWCISLCVVLLAGIFVADILTPIGIVDGMAYLLPVVVAGFGPSPRVSLAVAGVASSLTILGIFLSPPGASLWVGVTNRLLSVGAIWLTAWLVWQWRQASQHHAVESSKRHQSILQHSEAIIFVKDLSGRHLEVSDGFARLARRGHGSVIGKTDQELFSPELANLYRVHDQMVIETGTAQYFEEEAQLPDGLHTFAVNKFPIRDERGRLMAIGGIATDITARLEAEAAQRDAQERYDLVVRATQTGIWDWDLRENRIYYSSLWKQSLGYADDEITDSPTEWESRLHPEDKDRALALVGDYLSGRIPHYELTHRLRHKNGAYRWIQTFAVLARDADGRPIRMTGSHVDITERKRAEEALRESESTLRTFFESDVVMMGIVELTNDGDILHVSDNHRTAEFFGTTPEAMRGKRASVLGAPPDVIARWRRAYLESQHTGKPVRFEYEVPGGQAGAGKWLFATVCGITTYPHPSGPDRFAYVVDDVTDRRRMEQALIEARERLEARVRERTLRIHQLETERSRAEKMGALGQLAADIAHEVNNPLAGIKNAFHLVKQGIEPTHRHSRFVALIDREIERLAAIVKKMYGLHPLAPTPARPTTTVAELAQDIATLLDQKLSARQLRLVASIQAGLEAVVLPRTEVFQVLLNLVQNAIEASPVGQQVGLKIDAREGRLYWTVTDQGEGMSPELLSQIFEPFFSTKAGPDRQCLGLGLSVSVGLARAIGGRLEVRSQPGSGSTFVLIHPVSAGRSMGGDPQPHSMSVPKKELSHDEYAATHPNRR